MGKFGEEGNFLGKGEIDRGGKIGRGGKIAREGKAWSRLVQGLKWELTECIYVVAGFVKMLPAERFGSVAPKILHVLSGAHFAIFQNGGRVQKCAF